MASASIAELPEMTDTIYLITAIARLAPSANKTARSELLSVFFNFICPAQTYSNTYSDLFLCNSLLFNIIADIL
jgi:hypothetical protein